MTTQTFTLIVEGTDLQSDELVDDLFEAGCDDALISRASGIQFADFDRDADSLHEAVLSAIAELKSIAGITEVRLADPGWESMAETVDALHQAQNLDELTEYSDVDELKATL
ncbi:hypothetical protein [Candidatus Poriferisodalis sp.]|uniref:hypothetical protein n=1 Tax=Candidatus Poriferisodalis sp. TaxID=3101277 RepID=UPI003AF494EE